MWTLDILPMNILDKGRIEEHVEMICLAQDLSAMLWSMVMAVWIVGSGWSLWRDMERVKGLSWATLGLEMRAREEGKRERSVPVIILDE